MPILLKAYETKIGAKRVKLGSQYQRRGQKSFWQKLKIVRWCLVDNSQGMVVNPAPAHIMKLERSNVQMSKVDLLQ